MVYGVGLDHFFAAPEEGPVLSLVRRSERLKLPDAPDAGSVNYLFESLDFPAKNRRFSAYLAEFRPLAAERVREHRHPTTELVYVMTGELEIRVGKETHTLREGDAISFDASVSHGYRRIGKKSCTAIVVSTL